MRSPICARFRFLGLGFCDFLLAHQRADFFGGPITGGFELLDFAQDFSPLFIEFQKLVDFRLVVAAAGGKAFPNEFGFFTYQFDIEHRRIIETRNAKKRLKAEC